MMKMTGVISVFTLSLCLLSPAQAEEQRYISIRNTDMVWVPGNVCVWQFRLDNGGSGEGFGPLTLSLRLKDKGGNTLAMGNMTVAAFGDSDATRSQEASLENECVENVSSVEIMRARKSVMVTRLTCHCLFSTRSITNRCKSRLWEVRRLSQFFTRLIQPLSLMPQGLFVLRSLYA